MNQFRPIVDIGAGTEGGRRTDAPSPPPATHFYYLSVEQEINLMCCISYRACGYGCCSFCILHFLKLMVSQKALINELYSWMKAVFVNHNFYFFVLNRVLLASLLVIFNYGTAYCTPILRVKGILPVIYSYYE